MNELTLTFWGVRGSLAAPGAATAHFGGNTSAVEISAGETTLLFDAGTGLRAASQSLMERMPDGVRAHLFFSHLHWDHIQGLPFFAPVYRPDTRLDIVGPAPTEVLRSSLKGQMTQPNFPVPWDALASKRRLSSMPLDRALSVGNLSVRATPVNHPGGCLAYRVDFGGRSIVYATDHESEPAADARLIELARGADVLIFDAMYTPEEYEGRSGPSRVGWGHSTFRDGARVAQEAGIGQLVLFHHDPERNDAAVETIVERCRLEFPATIAAREGARLQLPPRQCAA